MTQSFWHLGGCVLAPKEEAAISSSNAKPRFGEGPRAVLPFGRLDAKWPGDPKRGEAGRTGCYTLLPEPPCCKVTMAKVSPPSPADALWSARTEIVLVAAQNKCLPAQKVTTLEPTSVGSPRRVLQLPQGASRAGLGTPHTHTHTHTGPSKPSNCEALAYMASHVQGP